MKSYRIYFLFLVALLALVACQPPAPTASAPVPPTTATAVAPTADGGVPAANPTEAPNAINKTILLDPALAADADSLKVNQYLYEGLVSLDANGAAQPALAASWVISDDQLDYIFTLRPNAAFSDGKPITADTVVDNFNRWFDPQSPLRGTGAYDAWQTTFAGFLGEKNADGRPVSPVDGIEKVDVYTVIIHLNRPEPEFLKYAANPAFAILDPQALAAGNYGNLQGQINASGPYQVDAVNDKGLTLRPNPFYWGVAAQANLEFPWR